MDRKILIGTVLLLASAVIYGCGGGGGNGSSSDTTAGEKRSLSGYVQKGPFINGTPVTVSELESSLAQTGRNFNTSIEDDKGTFELNDIELSSNYVLLSADGFYYDEVKGYLSEERLYLTALADISDTTLTNINILSHLEKSRVEYLVKSGLSFKDAKKQAQTEVLAIFNISKSDMEESEKLDISKEGDDNAILLAISAILQGSNSVAELTQLLSNISADIEEDGTLDTATLQSELINSAKPLYLTDIRTNLVNRYSELGVDATIPDFEQFVNNFIQNTSYTFTLTATYPATGSYGENILGLQDGAVIDTNNFSNEYSLAAELPAKSSLRIKIRLTSSTNYADGVWWFDPSYMTGWSYTIYDFDNNEQWFTVTATEDMTADMKLMFSGTGSAEIEFYENNSATPTIKSFSWHE
ncbi:MAG: hypothetical protein Q7T53_00510 [Deltaproteobacteria bacterium]|nr:hypothetical protein [Deltaproteobacteria bacterium]